MQPTSADNQAAEPADGIVPADSNSTLATDNLATGSASPPVSSAMSDALAATAAASAVGSDDSATPADAGTPTTNPLTPPIDSEPADTDSSPIFGPTPPSEALANDPLSSGNNSSAPVVSSPTSEQAINSSVDALVADAPIEPPVTTVTPPAADMADDDEPAIQAPPVMDDLPAVSPGPVAEGSDDLMTMKQQALQQLSPLVGHLDQTPEEKFRTTMMMLQATDNPALVKEAYELAQQITDEKVRAQALLDVVNEINYFTHQQSQPNQPPVFTN